MSTPKERHYWSQLRAALTAGQWLSSSPAKAPNGSPLPWSELFRKFNKHCRGFADVAQVASSTRALAVLLAANSKSKNEDQDEWVPEQKEGVYALELGEECILPAEQKKDGMEKYEELKKLESANFDTLNFALAYYAYALGNPSECLAQLAKVPDVAHVQNHIPLPSTLRASTLQVPSSNSSSASSSIVSTDSVTTATPSITPSATISIAEIKDGRAWAMAETIRSLCLQGMSHELLSPSDPKKALAVYSAALPLLTIVETEFTTSSISPAPTPALTSSGKGKVDFTAFTRFREIWRWVERLLWRAIVLGSRIYDLHHDHRQLSPQNTCKRVDSLWTWLEHYTSCSAYWPSNFRTEHRATVSALYLRALVLRYAPSAGLTSNVKPSGSTSPPAWMHTARSLIQEYRAILNVSTRFPRAGERNWKVEDFVDMCVAIWEVAGAGAEYTGWVLDVLEWATRLTFNCPRILRHMTRLLYFSGDTALAKRTLRLYVQVVSKALQTIEAAKVTGVREGSSDDSVEPEPDDRQKWIETLVFGARMLCRIASASSSTLIGSSAGTGTGPIKSNWKEMTEELREAEELIEKAKDAVEKGKFGEERNELMANVLLAEGIWNWVMGLKEQNPLTRPSHLDGAHALFKYSIETHATSAAHYHLALSYAYKHAYSQTKSYPHPGADGNGNGNAIGSEEDPLDSAIQHAALATELCPQEIRYWHLLGLLSAKMEKWDAAVGSLDMGRSVGEGGDQGDETEVEDEETQRPETSTVEGLPAGDGGGSHPLLKARPSKEAKELNTQTDTSLASTSLEPLYILSPSTYPPHVPPASELLQPASASSEPSHRYQSRYEAFEHALQLRMTEVTVSEYVEGAEGAAEKLREVFEWVAERKGLGGGSGDSQPRPSFEGGRSNSAIMKLKSPSELRLGGSQSGHGHDETQDGNKAASDSGTTQGDTNGVPERPSIVLAQQNSANSDGLHPPTPIPIMISPATPEQTTPRANANGEEEKDPMQNSMLLETRDASKPKKMQERLKNQVGQVKSQVHKGSARISTISKKIGHGVVRNGSLRRVSSTSDLHSVLRPTSYQASSIHSRRRNSFMRPSMSSLNESPPPPPPPVLPPSSLQFSSKWNNRAVRENRLLSDLWLMSAATFRRLGKIEQAKGAIQEAEVKDEGNPAVWVQLGLYYIALGRIRDAIESFHKALFISADDITSTIHLSRIYLFPEEVSPSSPSSYSPKFSIPGIKEHPDLENVDLAAGMLEHITKGPAWDVPEAWYFLGKAYGFQGRKEKERECLSWALKLSEKRGVRDMLAALGMCL